MRTSVTFEDVMKNSYIDTYFQPVVELKTGRVIGYEALSRGPKDTNLYMPSALIAEAKSRNRMRELDYLLRKMTLVHAEKQGLHKLLFINIDPVVIYEGNPSEMVVMKSADFGIQPQKVVIEVSERNAICSFEKFQNIIGDYKKMGFSIACDDVNSGFSNISTMSKIDPDYIKVDSSFLHGIDNDEEKQQELKTMVTLATMTAAKLIAVGIETDSELQTVFQMGVYAVQGNFIGVPKKEFTNISMEAAEVIEKLNAVRKA